MPVDFTGRDELLFGDPDTSIFGDTPIYARQPKSRRFGFSKPAATTSVAAAPRIRGDTALGAVAGERAPRKSGGLPAAALIAAPAAIVLLGGAFFLMQPRETAPNDTLSVAAAEPETPLQVAPELAPPPATPEAATAPVNKVATPPAARAQATPRATQVARARPAPRAPTVEDLATEASATAPVASSAPASGTAVNPAPLDIPAVTAPTPVNPAAVNPPMTGPSGPAQQPVPDASAVTP